MHHRPGSKSLKPDALSRRPDHGKGEDDNSNVTLLKPEYFQIQALRRGHVVLTGEEQGLLRRIRNAKDFDEPVAKAMELLKRSGQRSLAGEEWSHEQDLILFRGKVYVQRMMISEGRLFIIIMIHQLLVTQGDGRHLSWCLGIIGGLVYPDMLQSMSKGVIGAIGQRHFLLNHLDNLCLHKFLRESGRS